MTLDVAIVGGGFAGASLAHALANKGFGVELIDRRSVFPDLFRAEKIEPDQADIMRELGIFELRAPAEGKVGVIINFDGETREMFDTVDQYGIAYGDTVNKIRENLPESVRVVKDSAARVELDSGQPRVVFVNDRILEAKLVVIAAGGALKLTEGLGIQLDRDDSLKSLSFGFDIRRTDGQEFEFSGFNYYIPPNDERIDYLTIFPIGSRMRVNLFSQLSPTHDFVKKFKTETLECLRHFFPMLEAQIGSFEISSKTVQTVPTTYYRLKDAGRDGVVVIGDEYQSVSPNTGRGLSKVLTDVSVLANAYIPRWLDQETISASDVADYYQDGRKRSSDERALAEWIYYRDRGIDRGSLFKRVTKKLQMGAMGVLS